MQKLRVYAIEAMVHAVVDEFGSNIDSIMSGTYRFELLKSSRAGALCSELKKFALKHVYSHRSVLEIELRGHKTIRELMQIFWKAILATREGNEVPFDTYVNRRMSENYRRIANDDSNELPPRYRDCQLLTDMMAGMTDGHAVELCRELRMLGARSQ
jgi:dGTPase